MGLGFNLKKKQKNEDAVAPEQTTDSVNPPIEGKGLDRLPSHLHNRKKIVALLAIMLLVVGAFLLFMTLTDDKKDKTVLTEPLKVCSDELLQRFAAAEAADKLGDQATIVEEIEKTDNYQADPQCLYATLTYYVELGHAEKSQSNYRMLKEVYDPINGFSPSLGYDRYSINDFEVMVAVLKTQSENVNETGYALPSSSDDGSDE